MYVITNDKGLFVSRLQNGHSYTKFLQHAKPYETIEKAKADLCPENEHIQTIDGFFER